MSYTSEDYYYELKSLNGTEFQLEVTRNFYGNSYTICTRFPKSGLRDLVAMLNEYCLECGAHDPMQDEPQWHESTCSINEGEHNV